MITPAGNEHNENVTWLSNCDPPDMRFIGYTRVSDKEQIKKGFSIQAQTETIEAWAGDNGYRLVKIVTEPGRSGSKPSQETRPAFESAISYVLAGGADGLVVKWMDRFARNVEDFLRVRSQFYQAEKNLISISEPLLNGDPSDPVARYIAVAIMNAYQLQAELSGVKAAQGRERRARAGQYPGTVPIGYEREDHQVTISPTQGSVIAASFRDFSTGHYTLDSWTAEADKRGYRNNHGEIIQKGGWHRIFRNSFYIGRYCWNGQEYVGDYIAVTDPATFQTVQNILDNHGPGEQQQRHFWLLAGLLWSECHARPMVGALIKNKFGYYRASGNGRPEHNVRADDIESRVIDYLGRVRWVGENVYRIPEQWRLAIQVSANMGQIWPYLGSGQAEKREFLRLIFARQGIRVAAGGAITGVDLLPGFEG